MDDVNANDEHVWTRPEFKSGPPETLPEDMLKLLVSEPLLAGEGDVELQALEVWRCPVCGDELGEETTLMLTDGGILAVVCKSLCIEYGILLGYIHGELERVHTRVQEMRQENEDDS